MAGIESKGIEDLVLENADSNVQELYQEFIAAIKNGHLMEPKGKSANDFYEILIKEKSIEKLHGFMRRNFAAALQDGSQKALHDYFYDTEKYYSEYVHTKKKSTKKFSKYLKRAIELLGENHYMNNSLKTRQYYFEALNIRENKDSLHKDSVNKLALQKLNKALQHEKEAAFVYKAIGDIYRSSDSSLYLKNYQKAIGTAPDWAVLYVDLGMFYRSISSYQKAVSNLKTAIQKDSNLLIAYRYLGWIPPLANHQKFTVPKTISIIENMLKEGKEIYPYYYLMLGEAYWLQAANFGDYSGIENGRAEEVMKTAIDRMGDNVVRAHTILGEIYYYSKKYDKAIGEYGYVIGHPKSPKSHVREALAYMADIYFRKYSDCEKAEGLYLKKFQYIGQNESHYLDHTYENLYKLYMDCFKDYEKALQYLDKIPNARRTAGYFYKRALLYHKMNDLAAFENMIQDGIEKFSQNYLLFYNNACLYSLANNLEKAIEQLEISINKGYKDYGWMQQDTDLDNIRNTPEFKELMQKHFPNQHKK